MRFPGSKRPQSPKTSNGCGRGTLGTRTAGPYGDINAPAGSFDVIYKHCQSDATRSGARGYSKEHCTGTRHPTCRTSCAGGFEIRRAPGSGCSFLSSAACGSTFATAADTCHIGTTDSPD
jgi:hypothetical protein